MNFLNISPNLATDPAHQYVDRSLRDAFASNAMLALITTSKTVFTGDFVSWDRYAVEAYKIADAMLRARDVDTRTED